MPEPGTAANLSTTSTPVERPPETDASLYLHPQTLARLGSFELRAKMIVEGLSSGTHRSPFQGFSVEFAQHRPYVAGDDPRHLDWKVFGRTDKLQLKQYQQETNLDLIVMVDASGSMFYGSRPFAEASGVGTKTSLDGRTSWSKYDHATALAAALAYITLHQGDRVGLVIYADEVKLVTRRLSSMSAWRQVVGALSTHPVETANRNRPTDLSRALDQALAKVTNHCIIAMVGDFFFDLDALRAGLARIRHAGHDLIAFQVLDRQELEFNFTDTAPFEGLEGEARVRIDPRALREGYLASIRKHIMGVESAIKSFGFDSMVINTHDWLGPALAGFVARRNAQIKRGKAGGGSR
jgi:uncharacterized protein (DUF58 family)